MSAGCEYGKDGVTEITEGWGSLRIESDCSIFQIFDSRPY